MFLMLLLLEAWHQAKLTQKGGQQEKPIAMPGLIRCYSGSYLTKYLTVVLAGQVQPAFNDRLGIKGHTWN